MKSFVLSAAFSAIASFAFAQDSASMPILFTNVDVFDGISEQLIENANVVVTGNTITEVSTEPLMVANAQIIDGRGRTLMPGLIDSHVHFNLTGGLAFSYEGLQAVPWSKIAIQSAANARDHLLDGFTTVRDACGMDNGLQQLIDQGIVDGPRIYPSGACVSPTSGHGDARDPASRTTGTLTQLERLGIVAIADGPDEVRTAVRRNLSNGAALIKMMAGGGVSSSLDPLYSNAYSLEEMKAAVDAAAFFDTYVMIHAYLDESVNIALDAGVKVVDHGQTLSEETVIRMVDEGIFWSVNMGGLDPSLLTHPNFASGPQRVKLDEYFAATENVFDLINKYLPELKLVFNVDTVLSTMQQARAQRSFEIHTIASRVGNFEALRAMTSTAGELAALTGKRNPYPNKLGVIETGAYADILLVEGNPLEDISVIGGHDKWFDAEPREAGHDTIDLIMKDGVIYKNTLG